MKHEWAAAGCCGALTRHGPHLAGVVTPPAMARGARSPTSHVGTAVKMRARMREVCLAAARWRLALPASGGCAVPSVPYVPPVWLHSSRPSSDLNI